MRTFPLLPFALCGVVVCAAVEYTFEGDFVVGTEYQTERSDDVVVGGEGSVDDDGSSPLTFLQLVDVARRQYAATEFEYQSVNQLYRGDWDGIMEGPTWGAFWTQNSFGPVMGSLPFMDEVTFAAHAHSMKSVSYTHLTLPTNREV